jgi:hypothetical protein
MQAAAPEAAGTPFMTGLYDDQGVLRCAGRDAGDCLAYAALFGLDSDRYSLAALEAPRPLQSADRIHGDQPLAQS